MKHRTEMVEWYQDEDGNFYRHFKCPDCPYDVWNYTHQAPRTITEGTPGVDHSGGSSMEVTLGE